MMNLVECSLDLHESNTQSISHSFLPLVVDNLKSKESIVVEGEAVGVVCEDEVNKGKVVDGQPSESGWCEMLSQASTVEVHP